MYMLPSGFAVYVLWHMFGSFVLLRALDAVVATASAEEREEAFIVPFEAVVAFLLGSVTAVGPGAVSAILVETLGSSESSGLSSEKSSVKRSISIKHVMEEATLIWAMGYVPACRPLSKAPDVNPPSDKIIYTRKSIKTQLLGPIQLFLPSMIFARACYTNKLQ